ncbi:MAG: hypothetical protein LC658_09065 [Bacteroidales bacterium]|nr:hypothetical protein [Bacteroidales bacterium]
MKNKELENILSDYYDLINFQTDDNPPGEAVQAASLVAASIYQQNEAIKEQTQEIKKLTDAVLYISECINWQGNGMKPIE